MKQNEKQRKRRGWKNPARHGKQAQSGAASARAKVSHGVSFEVIADALARSLGSRHLALRHIRRQGFDFTMSRLNAWIAKDTRLHEMLEEANMELPITALEALHSALQNNEEWAIKQVLNSPRAAALELGQPSAKVAIDARSVSVNGSGVLDSIDLNQRLARLGTALQCLAATPPAVAEIAPQDANDTTSHNPDFVSLPPITEPNDASVEADERGAEAETITAPDAGAPDATSGDCAAEPRRPDGGGAGAQKRKRTPGRGKKHATGGGL